MTTCDREQKTLEWYTERFEREYRDARVEYERLSELFKDVCWYNFETHCRDWKGPWHRSDRHSAISLHSMQFKRKWNRGCLIEHGSFPVWYEGTVGDAPLLPPEIVLNELRDAKEYMLACKTQMTAPYDWAPGGPLYEELRRTTRVGRQCVYAPKRRRFSSSEL